MVRNPPLPFYILKSKKSSDYINNTKQVAVIVRLRLGVTVFRGPLSTGRFVQILQDIIRQLITSLHIGHLALVQQHCLSASTAQQPRYSDSPTCSSHDHSPYIRPLLVLFKFYRIRCALALNRNVFRLFVITVPKRIIVSAFH